MLYLEEDMPRLGIWKLEETEEELLAILDLREEYLPRLATMRNPARRREWLAVRVLLKRLLGEEALLAYRPNGAPYLPGRPCLTPGISHTEGYAALLLQPGTAAGIDIEHRSDRVCRVRDHFLSAEEIAALSPGQEAEQMLVAWCVKEALFKMLGETAVDFRRHLHIQPFELQTKGTLLAQETRTSRGETFHFTYRFFPDFVLVYSTTICPAKEKASLHL